MSPKKTSAQLDAEIVTALSVPRSTATTLEQKLRELVEHGGLYASTHDLAVLHGVSDATILRLMKKLNAEGLVQIIEGEAGHSRGRSGTARQPKIYYWVTM